tara:strand:+ start:577 stop:2430 length:1854 start_codon:yes stop_codon:yes gene_type:complete
MREFFQGIVDQVGGQWQGLARPVQLVVMLGIIAGIIALVVVGFFWMGSDYVLLYSGLNTSDTTFLAYSFKEEGIRYKMPNPDEIEVRVQDVDHARRIAAGAQLGGQVSMYRTTDRKGQKGYELLESGNLRMLSQDEFRELKRQAFEGELARTISTFSGVEFATVKLSLPEHQPFVRDQEPPKASVTLTLLPESIQGEFTVDTLKAIQRVVTYSIPGLKNENVHIVDNNGVFDSQELIKNKKTPVDQSSEILSIKNEYEDHYMKKLKNALKIYEDKVHVASVEVSADLTDIKTTKEQFQPSLTEEGTGVVRSKYKETESFEGQGSIPGGEPGVESNLFPPEYQYSMGGSGPSTYDKGREIQNYEMDKIITEEKSTPQITVLSAAVMVDFSLEGEVDNIKDIVAKTLGFATDPGLLDQKIAVSLSQFQVTKAIQSALESTPPPVWTKLGEMIVVALVVIAILVFLRSLIDKPIATTAVESERPIQLGEEHLPKGLTVEDYVNQWLEVRFSDLKKEFEAEAEQETVESKVAAVVDSSERKQAEEEQAKIEAIEAEKRAQEEEVLRQEAEIQRRKDTFDQIRQFAEDEPGATADILRSWVTESGMEVSVESTGDSEVDADA